VIGSQSINVLARRPNNSRLGGAIINPPANGFPVAAELMCFEDSSGLEVCVSDDGRERTYSDGDASITFRSYRDTTLWVYHEIGTKITTRRKNFDAANIFSRYYGNFYAQTCGVVDTGDGSATNDNDLDEYEWWINSPSLERVESLCRVQWNGRRISGVVSIGQECFTVGTIPPWPEGYPENWPPLNPPEPNPVQTIEIRPGVLEFHTRTSRPTATKALVLTSTFINPITVTVEDAVTEETPADPNLAVIPTTPTGQFNNVSGQFNIPPNGSVQVDVTFLAGRNPGSNSGSLRITWATDVLNQRTVPLLGTHSGEFSQ